MFHNLIKLMSVSYYFVFLLKQTRKKFNRVQQKKRKKDEGIIITLFFL